MGASRSRKDGDLTADGRETKTASWLWWLKNVVIAVFSVVFLLFGIDSLTAAYRKKNVFEFIMYFFSSNMIILVSIVGIIYPFFQIRARLKPQDKSTDHEDI